LDPFEIWKKWFKQSDYDESIDKFMDKYNIEPFQKPKSVNAQRILNRFFTARYGMFAGMDMKRTFGIVDFNIGLIQKWEKPKELKRMWNLAIISGINSGQISWDDIKEFKKDFTQCQAWKKYQTKNTSHDLDRRLEDAED